MVDRIAKTVLNEELLRIVVRMMCDENDKLSGQTFSCDNDGVSGEWRVSDILAWAEKHRRVVDVPMPLLAHNLLPSDGETTDELPGSPEFIARAMATDTSYPLLVVSFTDGLWIADGVHRLWKLREEDAKSVRARIVPARALLKIVRSDEAAD